MAVKNPMYDNVHKPSHYVDGRKFEPKDVIRDWRLNFNLGNAVKYLARAGRKDDIVQDLKKAQEYIDFEIQAIEAERAHEPKKEKNTENKKDPMERMFRDMPPVMRALVENELYSVEPIVIKIPDGADPEEFIAEIKKRIRVE